MMLSMLVNHLWQSTLFAAAIALLTLLVRNNGAHARYWLWWAASVKFLVPFSLLTALGARLIEGAPPIYVFSQWSAAFEKLAEPMAALTSSTVLTLSLLGVWACGSIAVLGRWSIRAVHIEATLRSAVLARPALTEAGSPAVKLTDSLVEPGIVGIFRPVLLLPRGIIELLTPAQLQAVLAHELCHWRRRDNLTAAVHMLVEALFWFHPLVWWIGARLIDERERACDEAVVASGHDGRTYAEGILSVCRFYVASSLACAAGVSGSDLKRRVTEIVRNRPLSRLNVAKKALLGAAALCALGVPIAVGLVGGSPALAQADPGQLLVRVAPNYPPEALRAGLDGSVQLQFTITEQGTTTDIVAISSTSVLFEQPAIDALLKWKYTPRIADGRPIEVRGVQTVIRFVIERGNGTIRVP